MEISDILNLGGLGLFAFAVWHSLRDLKPAIERTNEILSDYLKVHTKNSVILDLLEQRTRPYHGGDEGNGAGKWDG